MLSLNPLPNLDSFLYRSQGPFDPRDLQLWNFSTTPALLDVTVFNPWSTCTCPVAPNHAGIPLNWRLGVFEGHTWGFWLLDPAADSHLQDCTHEVFRRLTNLKVDRLFDHSIR
jgi:hypothetical protein